MALMDSPHPPLTPELAEPAPVVSGHFLLVCQEGCRHFPEDSEIEPWHQVPRGDGYSDRVIWPLFHELQETQQVEPEQWLAYCRRNRRFAAGLAAELPPGEMVVVRDHRLLTLATELDRLHTGVHCALLLPIPFPSPDLFCRLPQRRELMDAFLQHDLIGFESERDLLNFRACVKTVHPDVPSRPRGSHVRLFPRGRSVDTCVFPVQIDLDAVAAQAARPQVEQAVRSLRRCLGERSLLVGADPLDPAAGLALKLAAYERLLERHPGLHDRVCLFQAVIPGGRGGDDLAAAIEERVGSINGRFGTPGWTPVHYLHRDFEPAELLALFRAADCAAFTPARDGTPLRVQAFLAAQLEARGALVLSEFSSAAPWAGHAAFLANPFDPDATAEGLRQALATPAAERQARMAELRRRLVSRSDWVDRLLWMAPAA